MGSVYRTVADKLKLLRLAKEYGTVTGACDVMNFSRDSYYRIRALYERYGKAGLKPKSRRRARPENRVKPHEEEVVLAITREHPDWSAARVAVAALSGDPRLPRRSRQTIWISPTGVRAVWLELTRFRGHPIVGAERKVHDAEEPSAVLAGVPAADRRAGP